ncbi:hypothetical protein HMPREF1551_02435 [Capnocytophaga sp. oral taxon 863 str. F0517]|nr:hypothetical protein HMPREF1551_02435 [Capnocytophaga sp. oral taxon 863 str. F0517]
MLIGIDKLFLSLSLKTYFYELLEPIKRLLLINYHENILL